MPNIFISSNNSSTAVYAKNLKSKIKKKVDKDFGDFGEIIWVNKEEKIDFFTAMFGGGPAYFFYILNCFNEIIKKIGNDKIPRDILFKIFQLNISIRKRILEESNLTNNEVANTLTKLMNYEINLISSHD